MFSLEIEELQSALHTGKPLAWPHCILAGQELFLAAPAMWRRFHYSTGTALFVSPSLCVMEAAVMGECTVSCVFVCACFCVSVWSPVWFKVFCNFSAKVPGSSFDSWPYLDVFKAGVHSDLSKKPLSIHAVCVCVRVCVVFMCVFTPLMYWEPVLQGPQQNNSSLIQLPQQAELEGQQEARGQHGLLHTSFLTQGWTKRPINSEMCTYKLDFTFPSFSP